MLRYVEFYVAFLFLLVSTNLSLNVAIIRKVTRYTIHDCNKIVKYKRVIVRLTDNSDIPAVSSSIQSGVNFSKKKSHAYSSDNYWHYFYESRNFYRTNTFYE